MHQHSTIHAANNSVILKQLQAQLYEIHSIECQALAESFWNTFRIKFLFLLLYTEFHAASRLNFVTVIQKRHKNDTINH